MTRLQALRAIVEAFPADPVVAACGATARELASLGERPNCLYVQNSMGLAGPIAHGLALGLAGGPFRRCVVVEGDGGVLMGLGQVGTLALTRPAGLVFIVLDNGVHASTGGQPTASTALDLGTVFAAAGCGVLRAGDEAGLREALAAACAAPGPWFVHARIEPGNAPVPYFQADPAVLADRFATYLRQAAGAGRDG